jgi:hypothetical protein
LVERAIAKAERHHELGLGQILGRGLVHDLRHRPGALEEAVAHLRIAVDEDALPRHQHIVEDREPVALVEPRGERIIHHRGAVLMHHRRPADEAQPFRRDRDREPERIGRGLGIGREKVDGITNMSSE